MSRRILIKRDTSANWASNNPVLLEGELGLDTTLDKMKMGNGTSAWLDLPFITVADVSTLATTSQLSGYSTTSHNHDSSYLALSGDQSVGGVKTFSSFPVTPSSAPTTDYQVANKKFVLDQISSAGTTYTTGQIVDGDICVGLFNGDWLFMAPPNSRVQREWGGYEIDTGLPNIANVYNLDPNTGKYNTDYLLAYHSGIFTTSTAAGYCRLGLAKAYDLPNKEELMFIHQRKTNSLIVAAENTAGGTNKLSYFTANSGHLWSSSEDNNIYAWSQYFTNGSQYSYNKNSTYYWVVPVRRIPA